jgi:Tfp pilus assembly protein PilN
LNEKYLPYEEEAKKLENDFNKIQLRKKYFSRRGRSLEVLTQLYDALPLQMRISDIRLDEQGRFTVKGTAAAMAEVFSLVDSLQESAYFQDVKTKYTTKRREGNKDLTDFGIICRLREKDK